MTQDTLLILEIIVSVVGIIFILAQRKSEQGSSFFGGGGEVFKLRKGLDTVLFYATFVVLAIIIALVYIDIKVIN